MNRTDAAAVIRAALDSVGATDCPTPAIRFTRAYSYAGRARVECSAKDRWAALVSLSLAWHSSTPEGQRQTLVHEAMHIAAEWLYPGSSRLTGPHGSTWRALMEKAGAPADRCSNDPGAVGASRMAQWRRGRWVFCPCASHRVPEPTARKYQKWPGYTCRRCRSPISVRPYDLETTAHYLQGKAA
jgi:predicted SprT family Zn-dependent metalloprotease